MFWIIAAALTIVTVVVVIYPLTRKARQMASADAYDLTIYKSQLKEIDGDVERGLIDQTEAEAARAEVARRLLNAQSALEREEQTAASPQATKSGKRKSKSQATLKRHPRASTNAKIAGVIAVMVIPFVSAGLYFVLGSPNLQSQPLAARLGKPPEHQSMTELVASAERKLKQNPDDLTGWKKLAPIYLSMRRTTEAIEAYQNILRLEGDTVGSLSDLGEAIVVRDAGIVSEEALALFERAASINAKAPKPRFFLAIALGQQGKEAEAIRAWEAMIADSDANAPWVPFAKGQIATLNKRIAEGQAGQKSTTPPHAKVTEADSDAEAGAPGPTRKDMQAAAEMSSEDRQQMIENMVTQLAERLDEEGGTADEWVRLIRAQSVLKRPDMASKSVTKALDALQSDVAGLEKIKAAARSLGVSINQ